MGPEHSLAKNCPVIYTYFRITSDRLDVCPTTESRLSRDRGADLNGNVEGYANF